MSPEPPFVRPIKNEEHYNEVLSLVTRVRSTLWIGTADIKDLHVRVGSSAVPFLGVLSTLLGRGVSVRLIHAKEPGPIFREEYDRYPLLAGRLERVLCPRVHFKVMVFDQRVAYMGSANLTGAAMGMKSPSRRNFELGVLTNVPSLVSAASGLFDHVWMGAGCRGCGRTKYCGDRIK